MVRMPRPPSSPSSRPYHHGDLRATLLKSAERTLREKGAGALSLRELARAIGVSHAAPGRHFKDKQALLDALALDGYERLNRALGAAAETPGLDFEGRMAALARAYLGFAVDNPELLELMFARKHAPEHAPEGSDSSDRLAAAVDQSLGSITAMITDAQERGEIVQADPERITTIAAASLHGLAALIASCALDAEEAMGGLDEHVHLLLNGLRPR
ncbi:TetR/AcrR family transcriptional regulator [Streptomyces sp. FXJ1.172]|uniref:TetR/AcrR family transcriptional regulator n=1 Tax=Streptomyces sp. FXJ1.172 TaxID=710705 RepID=UPI0007CEFE44|nr:TetR/AcrR family transcriptional regulator [Streptomyces sp. FXJ1.172]WEO96622.1 TetR/AcrR family transcriptional regulator [Streptomyces sp. FXJ1.172]